MAKFDEIKQRMELIAQSREEISKEDAATIARGSADPVQRRAQQMRDERAEKIPIGPGSVGREVGRFISGGPSSFALQAANAGAFGFGPEIIGKLTSPLGKGNAQAFQEMAETELGAMREVNPLASAAGDLIGTASNQFPAGRILNLPGKAVARFFPTIQGTLMKRASLAAVRNITSGSTAIAAQNLLEKRNADDASFRARLESTIDQITSPTNLALTAGVAGVQSVVGRRRIDRVLQDAAIDFQRRTGFRPPIEAEQGIPSLRGTMQRFGSLPGNRGKLNELWFNATKAINDDIDDLRKQVAGTTNRKDVGAKAAAAIRRLPGDLRGKSSRAFAAGVAGSGGPDAVVDQGTTRALLDGFDQLKRSRPQISGAPEIDILHRKVRNLVSRGEFTVSELEATRKQISRLANFNVQNLPRSVEQAKADASHLYDVLRNAQRVTMPDMDKALSDIAVIQKAREALPSQGLEELDDVMLTKFFSSKKGFVVRWRELVKNSTPEDVDALKGWYMLRFIEKSVDQKTGSLDPAKMEKLLQGSTVWGRDAFDAIIGANRASGTAENLRKTLFTRGLIHRSMFKETGRLSSATRQPELGIPTGLGALGASIGFIAYMMENPLDDSLWVGLGAFGMAMLAMRSMAGGNLENLAVQVGRGTAPGVSGSAAGLQEAIENR